MAAQFPIRYHLPGLPHHGISRVIVGQTKDQAGATHGLGQIERVGQRGGERFVADHVDAGFEKRFGGRVVQMVWGYDGHGIDRVAPLGLGAAMSMKLP